MRKYSRYKMPIKSERYLAGLRFPLTPSKKRPGDFVDSDYSAIPLGRSPV